MQEKKGLQEVVENVSRRRKRGEVELEEEARSKQEILLKTNGRRMDAIKKIEEDEAKKTVRGQHMKRDRRSKFRKRGRRRRNGTSKSKMKRT